MGSYIQVNVVDGNEGNVVCSDITKLGCEMKTVTLVITIIHLLPDHASILDV